MINDYSKNVFNYFNVDRFVETGTYMGETPSTILDWGFAGKIDITEIKQEYCQTSTAINLLKILGFWNLRHEYDTRYSAHAEIERSAMFQAQIHPEFTVPLPAGQPALPWQKGFTNQVTEIVFALGAAILQEQEHWNFYSLAKKAGIDLPKLDKYNIFKSDTRDFLNDYTVAHDSKNTFFYLDAHWDADDYPLLEELKILANISHLNPIIAIDDFKTPGTNHGFDVYKEKVCEAPLIEDIVKEVTDTIYCCPRANFHNRGQAFVFYNRNKKDVQPLLDRYPLIEIPIK